MLEISLGIPVYNSAPYLGDLFKCLSSIDPPPTEIIFLDDASTDDSCARIEAFLSGPLAQGRLICNERNLGVAGAYNRLAEEARCEFLQILDADDLFADLDFFVRIQPALQDEADIVVTGMRSNVRILDLCARFFGQIVPRRPPRWLPLLGSLATRAGVVYRRRLLLENPFGDPAWPGSDVVHLLELRAHARCIFVAGARVLYRVHGNALSSQRRDYARYNKALGKFDAPTRLMHRLDLALRSVGQRWLR